MNIPKWLAATPPGSGDSVTLDGILGERRKGQHPEDNLYLGLGDIERIEQTYANPEWVAERRLDTQERYIRHGAAINTDLDHLLSELRETQLEAQTCNRKIAEDRLKAAMDLVSVFRDGAWQDAKALRKLYDDGYGDLDSGVQFVRHMAPGYHTVNAKLQPLTPERVVDLGKFALKLIQYRNSLVPFSKEWHDAFKVETQGQYGEKRIERAFTDSDRLYYEEIDSLYGNDTDESNIAKELCKALAEYSRNLERAWLLQMEDVDLYIQTLLRAIFNYLRQGVK